MEDVHTGRFSTHVWNILLVIVVVIKIFFKQLARLEFKFCEDLKVSHKMQLFTAKTIINLHENACGGIKFAHNFANKRLRPTTKG